MAFELDPSYKQVPERIADFKLKHPEGCLRPADLEYPYRIESIDGRTFIVYVAAAYRSPEDPLPGIGVAYEPFPGLTPYTKNSELMNAETSAWGRAIVAVLASESKSISSAEDVRNRQAEAAEPADPEADALRRRIVEAVASGAVLRDKAQKVAADHGVPTAAAMAKASADVLRSMMQTLGLAEAPQTPEHPQDPPAGAPEPEAATLGSRLKQAVGAKWEPTEDEGAEAAAERMVLLRSIAELCDEMDLDDEGAKAVLGSKRKDVAKVLGAARIADLKVAEDLLTKEYESRTKEGE
jgi:hypothetical protein